MSTNDATSDSGKPLSWFRMYAEAVDDEKLRLLAFEDRWHFVAILCCKAKGILDDSPLLYRKVAVKLGLDLRTLEEVARRLEEVGLIDAKTLQPYAWDDRQFRSDSSTERVRAFRQRMKREVKRPCNVSETAQETETETDKPIITQQAGDDRFDVFWKSYPRKVGKKDALKAWNAAKISGDFPELMAALDRQKRSEQWLKNEGQFVPHPATWIRGQRWNDELPGIAVAEKEDWL